MTRASRPLSAAVLVVALSVGGATLSGCAVVQNAVEGASGGSVDIGGTGVPTDYPKTDVPLTTGTTVYGAALSSGGSRVWNVTIKVAGVSAMQAIGAQLTAAGFATAASAGSDATGATGTYTKAPYTVIVIVSKPDAKTGWIANYTVTKAAATASPTPSASATK